MRIVASGSRSEVLVRAERNNAGWVILLLFGLSGPAACGTSRSSGEPNTAGNGVAPDHGGAADAGSGAQEAGGDSGGAGSGSAGHDGTHGGQGGAAGAVNAAGTMSTGGEPPGTGNTCLHPSGLILRTPDDVAQLAAERCEVLEGDLTIGGGTITALTGLETLRQINGRLQVNASKLTDFSGLANLAEVGDAFEFSDSIPLGDLVLPSLTRVGRDLGFVVIEGLTSVNAPKLEVVVGQVTFGYSNQLRTISLELLRSAGRLGIQANPILTTFNGFPSLTSLDDAVILDNPKLPRCEVAALDARLHACSICQGNDDTATCN